MNFTTAIRSCFQNFTNFQGRARRSEYWYFSLFSFLVSTIATALFSAIHLPLLSYVVSLVLFVPGLAVSFRRMHDIGKSAVYLLVAFIPFVGGILLLIWCVQDSQPGANKYGVSEKYPVAGPGSTPL